MKNITRLSSTAKGEIAKYIREDNLSEVNSKVETITIKNSFYVKYVKRFFDIICSLIALILTLPINFIIGVVTFFDVGSPIIFKQKRIGKNGKTFIIYKFRNMTNATDASGELLPPAQRVTKWGKFVRKTSLDELLNFVSVLKGDMSLVGPRPLLDVYAERFNKRDKQRYGVKPGLDCPSYKRLDHVMNWRERLDNDVWYVENCSLKVDLVMLIRIVQIAFDRKATAVRSKATIGGFLGYDKDGSVITTKAVPEKYCDMFCENNGYAKIEEAFLEE